MTNYPITVAALKAGEWGVAVALAAEIPADVYGNVASMLRDVRSAALAAGVEAPSVDTLAKQRTVGLWLNGAEAVAGLSVNVHDKARTAGITLEELRENPNAVADKEKAKRDAANAATAAWNAEQDERRAAVAKRNAQEAAAKAMAEAEARAKAQVALAERMKLTPPAAQMPVQQARPAVRQMNAEPLGAYAAEVKANADVVRKTAVPVATLNVAEQEEAKTAGRRKVMTAAINQLRAVCGPTDGEWLAEQLHSLLDEMAGAW